MNFVVFAFSSREPPVPAAFLFYIINSLMAMVVFDAKEKYTPKQIDDTIRQWVKTTNKWLKKYSELNDLPKITTYSARHTFASLSKSHLPVPMISKMLGHSRITTTQTYLGRFDNEENKAGLQKVFETVKIG